MNALLTAVCTGTLIGAAACGGSDEAPRPAPAASPADAAVAEMPETVPAESAVALPPGLAPVAVDDPDRSTADQATGGTAARPAAASEPPAPGPGADTPAAESAPQNRQDDGAEVLRRAAAAYEDVRSLQADFVMRFNNPLLRQQTTSRGTLYQQRPDRIALRFTDPDGDVILSDGEHFYVYQPSIDAKQATQSPASAGGGGGVDLQAQFVGNPTERFRYTVEGRENVGDRPAHVMVLIPRERAEY
ncbi:MAG: LolA family protein, partial [Longimicrobiales bacterium]